MEDRNAGVRTTADWSGLGARRQRLAQWSDKAVQLAADYNPAEVVHAKRRKPREAGRVLRLIPPVAALGTAWVMQVIAVTDTVGTALANRLTDSPVPTLAAHSWLGYAAALLLGVAVASCAEGGAAYLMDLYDKHLLARDSVWMLRLAMFVYVGGSAWAIHYWAQRQHLPGITSWLLAGMSGSALFLWSRGSRWKNREAMRLAGQLDPAMPRLSMGAKLLHPVRWAVTLWLVSWEPAETTEEARARYDAWHEERLSRKVTKRAARTAEAVDRTSVAAAAVVQSVMPAIVQSAPVDQAPFDESPIVDHAIVDQPSALPMDRPARTNPEPERDAVVRELRPVQRGTVVDQLANAIEKAYRTNPLPSRRKLVAQMVQCAPDLKWSSAQQVQNAIKEVNRRREAQGTPAAEAIGDDADKERVS